MSAGFRGISPSATIAATTSSALEATNIAMTPPSSLNSPASVRIRDPRSDIGRSLFRRDDADAPTQGYGSTSRTIARMFEQAGSWRRILGWGAIALLASYCLLIGGGWAGKYDVDLRRISLLLTTIGIGGWIVLALRDPSWRPRTVFAPGIVIALGVMAVTTITSQWPRLGVEYVAWAILLATLYLILQRIMSKPFFRDRVMAFATVAAFVIGIAFVILVVSDWVAWWGLVGRIATPPLRPDSESLTFGNPSAVMTVSILLTASAVGFLGVGSRRKATIVVAAVALALLVTLLSGSRAGWLGLAMAIGATSILWLLFGEHRRALVDLVRSRTLRYLAIPLVAAGSILLVIVGPGVIARASSGGEAWRTSFYEASVQMFRASPVVGLGPGTWAPQRVPFTSDANLDYYIPHAHDLYLQTAAEFGLLGLAAGIVVVFLLIRLLYRAVRSSDPVRRRFGWCATFATIYFGAHQLLDFYANAPAILFAFAIPIAWLDAATAERPFAALGRLMPRRLVTAVGLFAVVGAVAFLTWAQAGASIMQDGKEALDAGDASRATALLTQATTMDPAEPPYQFALGLALAKDGRLAEAEPQFLASATVDDLPETWLDLAAVRVRLGNTAGARDALTKSMRLGRQQSGVALGAGVVALELDDRDFAVGAFSQALTLSPSLAGDPWWTEDPGRAALWPEVYARAFESAGPGVRFELALETGDTAAVSASIESMGDAAARSTYRLIADGWAGDLVAVAGLQSAAQHAPLDGSLVNWLARIQGRLGNADRSQVYRDWSAILAARGGTGSDELRVNDGSVKGTIAGVSTLFYGQYQYRRPAPLDQFVPWLPHLVSL